MARSKGKGKVKRPPRRPSWLDTAAKMHRRGDALAMIANVCEVSPSTVWHHLKAHGLYEGAQNPRGPAFDAQRGRAVIAMRDRLGMTFADIGAVYDSTRQWAHAYIKRAREVLADEQAEGDATDEERDIALAYSEIHRMNKDDAGSARTWKRIERAQQENNAPVCHLYAH